MKKFILRLLLFCLAPMPLLFYLQHIVDTGLRRSHNFFYAEWTDLFNGTINADMLVMGTSRAWVQLSPAILDSALHVNSYNLGMDGTPFPLQYERFRLYLRHNKKPKYIIQEVGFISTLVKLDELPNPQQFLPYLNDDAIWKVTQTSSAPFSMVDRYFPMYKYNNELPVIKEGILSYMGKGAKNEKYKGYKGVEKVWDSAFHDFKLANPKSKAYPIYPQALAQFQEFLGYCKANDIKVIMVYPPAFIEMVNYVSNLQEIISTYKQCSVDYNAPFLNYMSDTLNYNRDNFYNSNHLNKHGSELFTRKFAADIREYVK